MEIWIKLIQAVSQLLWPILVLIIFFSLRKELKNVLSKIKRGKLLGQEIELQDLNETANKAIAEVSELPNPEPAKKMLTETRSDESITERILDLASKSPKASLIMLAIEIEKKMKTLAAILGGVDINRITQRQGLEELEKRELIPKSLSRSIRLFWEIRNRLVHASDVDENDITSAIDSGLTILKALEAIPHPIHVVHHPGVEVYSDPYGKNIVPGVKAIILETRNPDRVTKDYHAYPTTKTHFKKGMKVSWEWSNKNSFGESWYRDPNANEMKYGWTQSMEFVGRDLDSL